MVETFKMNPVNVVAIVCAVPDFVLDTVNVVVDGMESTKYIVSGITPQNVGSEKNTASPATMLVAASHVNVFPDVEHDVTLHWKLRLEEAIAKKCRLSD
jgi:hypothetical protein